MKKTFPLLLTLALLAHCGTSGTTSSDNDDAGDDTEDDDGGNAPTSTGAGSGPTGNDPADFPTIANLDFDAFPDDPGEDCPENGTTYYVATNGDDANPGTQTQPFRTIYNAMLNTDANDTVMVAAGNYAEGPADEYRGFFIEDAGVSLCAAAGTTVTVVPASGTITYGFEILANNVLVDGIDLDGFTTSMVVLGSSDPIQNIILKNMIITASGSDPRDGITAPASQVTGLLLKNVTVANAHIGIGCNAGPCADWRLDTVTVLNDNSLGDTGQDAIAVEDGDNMLFSNLEVTGAAGDGIDMKATRVAVFNAQVHANLRNGVKFWRGGDLVNSFVVLHGADAAVVFDGAGDYRILNSLIAYENWPDGGSYTMTVAYDNPDDDVTLALINSVFYNNASSIYVSDNTATTIQNCLFANTTDGKVIENSSTTVMDTDPLAALDDLATASGNLDFNIDPEFLDPDNSDFTFATSSSLVDAGTTPDDFPEEDYNGNPRTSGEAPDLGPLEMF